LALKKIIEELKNMVAVQNMLQKKCREKCAFLISPLLFVSNVKKKWKKNYVYVCVYSYEALNTSN
jgi:hypothetical protein